MLAHTPTIATEASLNRRRPVAVKICCIQSVTEAQLAIAAGADALGLVSAMPSGPGVIDEAQIAWIASAVAQSAQPGDAPVQTVLLTALTHAEAIACQHRATNCTALQLVDWLPQPELAKLRQLCPGVTLMQVIHVLDDLAIEQALAVAPFVDAVLLDSGNPHALIKELGGTGRVHNWAISRTLRDAVAPIPIWLAGGLHSDNVAEAIQTVQPFGVDVCSGVRSGGRLDPSRLEAFLAKAIR
jgi:phosphoribosylanthranilate isomerase